MTTAQRAPGRACPPPDEIPASASGWHGLRRAVAAGDAAAAADVVLRLGAEERREIAGRLRAYVGEARAAAHARFDAARQRAQEAEQRAMREFVREQVAQGMATEVAQSWWWQGPYQEHQHHVDWNMRNAWIAPLRVAGAGTLGGPAAVTDWLLRRDFAEWRETMPIEPLLRVVAARPAEWRADLAARLAARLRGTRAQLDNGAAGLTLELLRRAGGAPPEHEPLVVAWVSTEPDLAADPLAPHLIPRLFEAEGVGRALRDDRADAPSGRSWLRALAETAPVGRERLVEGCLSRFLRGGTAVDLRFFVRLHDLLDPAPDQERVRDYLRLLPAAPGPVAELALRMLRGPGVTLSGEEVGEAVTALLFRPESKLVRAGLTLLDRAARDASGDLDELAPALASAFLCESYEVRERAVRWAVKHAGRMTAVGAEAVREAAAVLPPDLAARLAPAYGAVEAEAVPADVFEPGEPPVFDAPARRPVRPAMETLARTYNQLHHEFAFERWLDGFVRHPHARRAPDEPTELRRTGNWPLLEQWTEALLRAAAGEAVALTAEGRLPGPGRVSPLYGAMLRRCAEVHAALVKGALPPYLLATPTHTSGHVDPAELVARLEGYERDGVRALPDDLGQALLRLPRSVDPGVVARAGRLTSEAGVTLTRWLTDRPEPVTGVEWPAVPGPGPRPRVRREPTGIAFVDALFRDPPPRHWMSYNMSMWWLVLPSDREVAAMHFIPYLYDDWRGPGSLRPEISRLCHQEGPAGEGMALLLGVLLGEDGWDAERCREPLLRAVATGSLPAAECGRQLARCLRLLDRVRPAVVVRALDECARRGAHREVWQIMSGLLPVHLPERGERATSAHTRMLEFAADVAGWAGARGVIPEVAGIAARGGSSGLVRAARRLHEQLAREDASPGR
ncbi:hypothetical protein Nocox_23960 [Nonomuraea coxensis DSM 45129]|uniref:DUF7824 domain-containing protein n=1 Tax=Nonomuraea coxensis DSM 45129 TaxID=1122611 RepID=A0ABX8U404_9ACTN|nr:hypothetical protein [Nonomuraea coxensis]QYC42395.1 hypothetical protein Nocox_23960 [Nonomuraea coxensis DSM 45129]